jgi:hypothetical protein
MEVQDVRFTRFYAAEHVQFGEDVCEIIKPAPFAGELPEFEAFKTLHGEETMIFKKLGGSYLTPEVEKCDDTRDIHTSGFMSAVKAMCHHYDPEIVDAAQIVAKALKPYKSICKITFNQESATLTHLITEMRKDTVAPAVAQLGYTEWVNRIEADNSRFVELVMQRNATISEKIEGNMKEIRSRVDPVYYALVRRINALMIIQGEDVYLATVKQLNSRIDAYRHTVAQRQAVAVATKKKVAAETGNN